MPKFDFFLLNISHVNHITPKVLVINYLLVNPSSTLTTFDILSLYCYSSIKQLSLEMIFSLLNSDTKNLNIFNEYLNNTLKKLPPYIDEAFVGVDIIDINDSKMKYSGTSDVIRFHQFMYSAHTDQPGTSLWKIATDNIHNYINSS